MHVFLLIKCEPHYRGDARSVHSTFEGARAAVPDAVRGWYRDERQRPHNVAKAKVRGSACWWEIHEHAVQLDSTTRREVEYRARSIHPDEPYSFFGGFDEDHHKAQNALADMLEDPMVTDAEFAIERREVIYGPAETEVRLHEGAAAHQDPTQAALGYWFCTGCGDHHRWPVAADAAALCPVDVEQKAFEIADQREAGGIVTTGDYAEAERRLRAPGSNPDLTTPG